MSESRRPLPCGLMLLTLIAFVLLTGPVAAQHPVRGECEGPAGVCAGSPPASAFPLIVAGEPTIVRTDPGDYPGLLRAAQDLRNDLERVARGEIPVEITHLRRVDARGMAVIAGVLGRNHDIDRLVEEGRLDVSGVAGEWEAYVQQVVDNPAPGIDRALVIAGSDMRGAIFGIYDLSERMGVSPWYWWADVPIERRSDLYVTEGRRIERPHVRYRGIFLNNENPSLLGWVNETYGGFNHRFYGDVFELILRLRGNFVWSAMWGKAFYDDDALNPVTAETMGVVVGTTHHEPMLRAHIEWERYGTGEWNYRTNAENLQRFWREGITRLARHQTPVVLGMRGDGDEAMSDETEVELMERIVADQRAIIEEVTGRPANETPQMWALYKEVLDYYDEGMQMPDDVMILFANDNWGNIRRVPQPGEERAGGFGMYYHFDYVGGPRNYKWINTTQIARTWEQMNIAWEFGADQLWLVNVGDLKPMELPISHFLTQAWNPAAMTQDVMEGFTRGWAAQQFGEAHADDIAALLMGYTNYNSRRKPEMVGPDTYSLVNFDEAERILVEWDALAELANAVRERLDPEYDDAYLQLVWYPVIAAGNLNRLHIETARNRLYAAQGRVAANAAADAVREAFQRSHELDRIYEEDVADGKWVHMMAQTRISYTYWQQPEEDVLPELESVSLTRGAVLGVAVEGDERAWPGADGAPSLPAFYRHGRQTRHIDLFDRGGSPARYTLAASAPWVRLSETRGSGDGRVAVSIDWDAAPEGEASAVISVTGPDRSVIEIEVTALNPAITPAEGAFVEADGFVAMEAAHFARSVSGEGVEWRTVPDLGRTLSSVTLFPPTAEAATPGGESPRLDYDVHLLEAGEVEVQVTLSPTLDFRGQGGLRYAVSIGDEAPQIINMHLDDSDATWERNVGNNSVVHTSRHTVEAGPQVLRIWMVDTGPVFQRIVIARGQLPQTYLGPPESWRGR